MNCDRCNSNVPEGAKFCPECGSAIRQSFVGPVSAGNPSPEDRQRIYEEEKAGLQVESPYTRGLEAALKDGKRQQTRRIVGGVLVFIFLVIGIVVALSERQKPGGPAPAQDLQSSKQQIDEGRDERVAGPTRIPVEESDSRPLEVSLDAVQQALGNEFTFDKPDHKPDIVRGQPRIMATSKKDALRMVEVIGPRDNLIQITLMFGLINDSVEANANNHANTLLALLAISKLLAADVPDFGNKVLYGLDNVLKNKRDEEVILDNVMVRFSYPKPFITATFQRPMAATVVRPKANTPEWYEGGTLHSKTAGDWARASTHDRIATSADFVTKLGNLKSLPEIKLRAVEMEKCLTTAIGTSPSEWVAETPVSVLATTCDALMH